MNCNEEFVIKTVTAIQKEFNFKIEEQQKLRDILYLSLYEYTVQQVEKGLMISDLDEKILLYLKVKKLENYSEGTLQNYLYILRNFRNTINKPVAQITKNDIRYFLSTYGDTNTPASINSKLFCIKGFFQWLTDEDVINNNPARQLKETKVEKNLRKYLTIGELERLRIACKDVRERALLEFLFATGCRVSEVEGANISDLNMNDFSLVVFGKGKKERLVLFSEKTKIHLENYLETRKDVNDALFISAKFPYQRLKKRGIEIIISKLGKRAGIDRPVYPHLIRHTMASLGTQAGADISTLQKILGHTSPATTQIYAKQDIENIKNQYRQFLNH